MPIIANPKTKAQKKAVVKQEMHEFKHGTLHSGSAKDRSLRTASKQSLLLYLNPSRARKSNV